MALRVPSNPDSNMPQAIKVFINKFFSDMKPLPSFEYMDFSPVKMKRGYKEAVYFRLVIRTDPKNESKEFINIFNDLVEYDGMIPGDIRLASIPETSGVLIYPEYNVDFIYYRGR